MTAQTNNWPFLSFPQVQSGSYFFPPDTAIPAGNGGFGDYDFNDEKGSGRSVSGATLKCHHASLFLAKTAAGICFVRGSFTPSSRKKPDSLLRN